MKKYLIGCGVFFGLGAIVGLVYLVWLLWLAVVELEPALLAAWAILATLALPVVSIAAFWLGKAEARALAEGIRHGIGHVTDAADKMVGTRTTAAREMRAARGGIPSRAGVAFNVFTPGAPGPGYLSGTGYPAMPTITPKALPPGDEVIDV